MESSHCNGLPFHSDVDHSIRHGYCPRPRTRHEEISSVAGHIPRQCAVHPLGVSHVRIDWHSVVFRVAYSTGLPQTSFYTVAEIFLPVWHCLPFAVHHDDHHFLVRARHPSGMYAPKETSIFRW